MNNHLYEVLLVSIFVVLCAMFNFHSVLFEVVKKITQSLALLRVGHPLTGLSLLHYFARKLYLKCALRLLMIYHQLKLLLFS